MGRVEKIAYFEQTSSLLAGEKWRERCGSQGCVPLDTPMAVSIDRLAPGEPAPPAPPAPPPPAPQPKPSAKQRKEREAELAREAARQKELAQQTQKRQKQEAAQAKAESKSAPTPKAEPAEKLPPFDLLDIPGAMDKMGWPVSAKLAREWFSRPKHVYDDKPDSEQPIDNSTVTLDWCLKFDGAKKRHRSLVAEKVYNDNAVAAAKKKLRPVLEERFRTGAGMSFDTAPNMDDLRAFHLEWQFQRVMVSDYDTVNLRFSIANMFEMNDLSGSLAIFSIYAAICRVETFGSPYYNYEKVHAHGTKTYCFDPQAKVTHIYVYVKDNYSFNDSDGNSQYLGHWNKNGTVLVKRAAMSSAMNNKWIHSDLGDAPDVEESDVDLPVDARRGLFKKMRREDVYWPVYNRTFNEWREKHNRGGDFMIYSKPVLVKLKAPIALSIDTVCKAPEKM